MWIFSSQGFLSIVAHSGKPDILIVRSRFRGHIERIFPRAHVQEDNNMDYRFRTQLPAKEVSEVIARMVSEISYDNFKACLDVSEEDYVNSCFDVYNAVARNSGDWDLENFIYGRRKADE